MITIKKCFSIPVLQITIGIAIAILGFSSCKNATETSTPADTGYKQPGEQPLKFTPIQKIDWAALPSVAIQPVIKKLDFSKLVSHSYDTAGLTPFTRPVTKAKFDYNSLPQKDFDIDKLPSKTLKFKTYLLEPPKLVKANMPHLKNSVLQLYEMGQTQGLEGLITSAIYTDHRGFLWIATDKGLYRYDGENFLVYLHGQIDFYIISLMEDKAGRMWMCLLNNGLEVLDTKAGTLKRTNKSLGLINNSTTSTLLDGQGKIWATFNPGGVAIIDPDMQSMKLVDKTHGLSDTTANCLVQDKNHKIWVGTDAGISVIDFKSKKIKYIDKSHGLRKDTVQNLLFDHDGRLWMAVREKIDVLDLQKKTVNYINEPLFGNPPGPNSFIRTLSQDGKGRVWAGNFNYGLAIIDLQNHGTRAMTFGDGLLPADRVISIDQDSRGQTWIGTAAGLQMVGNNKAIAEQIGTDQTNTLLEDSQGSIWQGTGKGVNIFDRKTKTVKNISTAEGLGHDNIETLNEIDGSISICSDGGWDLLDPSKTTITHLGKEQGLNSKVIYAVLKDNAGRFWIGGTKPGIDVYDPVTKALKSLGKTQGLNGSNTDMKKDSRGRIWIAIQSKGIDVVDPVNWTIQHINDVPGLKDNFNKVLFPDSEGNMWIGTDKGVYFADMDNKKLLFFSIAQGLVNEGVTSILSHNGSTYVSTNGGISVITPTGSGTGKKWHIESFGTSYIGLKTYIGSSLTDQLTKDGLYWWGDKGLTVLDLSKKEAFVPPTLITGINTMDEPRYFVNNSLVRSKDKDTLWDRAENHFKFGEVPKNTGYTLQSDLKWDSLGGPYHMPINLQLPHHQNFIQFHFSSLNFMPHDTAWYRYRLTGVDTGWSEKTFIPTSKNYFSLVPGKYTFEVSGKSSDNGWSKPAVFSFTINPPWWHTWWAYILYVLLFAGTVWAFVTYRSLQLIKEKRILEHKVHLRTEEVIQQKEEIEAQRDDLEKTLSELKTTQTQLIQSEKMASLGELTAGIAHEIQNPLNFVNNFAEVSVELLNELKEGSLQQLPASVKAEADEIIGDITENLQKISHHGKRADSIVKGMLQHSRNSSGQKELTDINVLADEYLRLSFHGLRAKDKTFNATMNTHFDETLPKTNMMQQDFGRVLLNLFTNAFYSVTDKKKLVGAGYEPTLTVTTKKSGNYIEVIVRDNGMGIPQKILDKIYQPFFTTKPTGQGTGLGLSMSYDIVKAHEGELKVNTVEGEFAEFIIKLPIN